MLVPELFSFYCGNILQNVYNLKYQYKGTLVQKVINLYFAAMMLLYCRCWFKIEFYIFTVAMVYRLPRLCDTRAEGAHMDSFATAHVTEHLYFLTSFLAQYLYTAKTHSYGQ